MTEQEVATNETTAKVLGKKKQSYRTLHQQKTIFIVSMLFIPIAHFLFEWIYINGSMLLMVFQNRDGDWSLVNFSEVWRMLVLEWGKNGLSFGLMNTIKQFLCENLIAVPISLVVSYFLYKQITGFRTFRILFYIPKIVSDIVIITVFKNLLSTLGPITALCEKIGITLPIEGLLYTPGYAYNTIIFYGIWLGACGNMLFYSSMSRVPPELTEAGKLDGLQLMKELWYVVLPLIWPTFSTTVVLELTGLFKSGGPVLLFGSEIVSKGEAGTLPYWFFNKVYGGGISGIGSYGEMSCVGLVFTAISVPLTLIVRHLLGKVNDAEY